VEIMIRKLNPGSEITSGDKHLIWRYNIERLNRAGDDLIIIWYRFAWLESSGFRLIEILSLETVVNLFVNTWKKMVCELLHEIDSSEFVNTYMKLAVCEIMHDIESIASGVGSSLGTLSHESLVIHNSNSHGICTTPNRTHISHANNKSHH
jgi:hypothetical protein